MQSSTYYIQPGQAGYSGSTSTSGVSPGSSTSSSSTTPTQTVENAIMNQISGVASSMASYLSQWASSQYAKTSGVTDQAVNNFFQTSQQMSTLGNSMTGQYNNLFAPENAQLVADANSYASPAHMAADMGAAGATAAQAGQAAEHNSTAQLEQYGIDPSSGRYASLINADNVQNAANVAGAMNTQQRADVATGQSLRAQAVATGAQLPSSIANITNTGIQANTGATNASLANANTGVNLMGVADPYLNTAMSVKMPFSSSSSSSASQSYPSTVGSSGGRSGGDSSGGGSSGGVTGGGSSSPSTPSAYTGMDPNLYGGAPSITSYGGSNGNMTGTPSGTTDPMTGDVSPAAGYGFASGGQVPATASPSGGQQTDDVRAQGPGQAPMRLNANEFVIPQDVALWKGQEFFQNLINDSRKKRLSPASAPAKPSVSPTPQAAMGVQ